MLHEVFTTRMIGIVNLADREMVWIWRMRRRIKTCWVRLSFYGVDMEDEK